MNYNPVSNERVYTDPVCGMKISYKAAAEILKYKNKTYCFCAKTCRETFEQSPEGYVVRK